MSENKVRLLRSAVPERVPTVEQCGSGMLAMNTADKKLYFGTGDEVHELAKQVDVDHITQIFDDALEPTGFVNYFNDSYVGFNVATSTFTITPKFSEYSIYANGVKYVKTVAESVVLDIASAPDRSWWYVYFNNQGVLTASQVPWGPSVANICTLLFSKPLNSVRFLGEERHGIVMDNATRLHLRRTFGTQYMDGLVLTNHVEDGDGDLETDCSIGITGGKIGVGDIFLPVTNAASPAAPGEQILTPALTARYIRNEGPENVPELASYSYGSVPPVQAGHSRLAYNSVVSGEWDFVEASADGMFIAMWVIATNNITTPVFFALGQREDSTLDQAKLNATYSSLTVGDLSNIQTRPLYRLIFETDSNFTNTSKARLAYIDDMRDVTLLKVSANQIADHESLANLLMDGHPQYMHTEIDRTVVARHTYNPMAPASPFILGTNAQGQKVLGLNSDLLDGKEAADFVLSTALAALLGVANGIATLAADGKLTASQVRVNNTERNHAFTFATGATTTLTATGGKTWVAGTTQVYVGGMRQKLGVDYVETSSTVVTLTTAVSQAEYDAGVNIVLDFSIA